MKKIKEYFEDSYNELIHKVTWPTWPELQNTAIVVMVSSLLFGIAIYLMDAAFSNVMKMVYSIFA